MQASYSESLDVVVVPDHDEPAQPEPASLHLAVGWRWTVQTLRLAVGWWRLLLLPGSLTGSAGFTVVQGSQVKQTQPSDSKSRPPLSLSGPF